MHWSGSLIYSHIKRNPISPEFKKQASSNLTSSGAAQKTEAGL